MTDYPTEAINRLRRWKPDPFDAGSLAIQRDVYAVLDRLRFIEDYADRQPGWVEYTAPPPPEEGPPIRAWNETEHDWQARLKR